MSNAPDLVQCVDCYEMTPEEHDYARISFMKTKSWRCPNCYHRWRMRESRGRGRLMTCGVPRCTSPRLSDVDVREVMDPVTHVVASVCPYHFDEAQEARLRHARMVDEQRSKDIMAAVTDAVSKAAQPTTLILPGNPEGIKHIAATLSLIAPDLDDSEVASVAESLYDMAQPALNIPVFTKP